MPTASTQLNPDIPPWMQELIEQLVFVGGYVRAAYPDIFEEAMTAYQEKL